MDAHARKLIALAEKGGRLPLKDCGGAKLVDPLEAQAFVRRHKEGRATIVEITEAGRRQAATWAEEARREAETRKPAPRARRPSAAAQLDERLGRIEAGVREILDRLGRLERAQPPDGPPPDLRAVKAQLLDTIAELDDVNRYGGLVPIPEIRRAARAKRVPDELVTSALEALEREFVIDLNVAQSPTTIGDRSQGIERPGRGLLYYVARRGG